MKEFPQNKKHIILIALACAVLFGSTIVYWLWDSREHDRQYLDIEFAGPIERVDYDIKQFPTIAIGDKTYYIGAGYSTDHQIEVGDSIIKKKGSYVYTLIKHRSNKIVQFKLDEHRF